MDYFSMKTRTEDKKKYVKENSGPYPAGSQPRCLLLLPVPAKGMYLSEYKACNLHSNEAISSTGTTGYSRTNHVLCQPLAWEECFTICSNKYGKSSVKHQKHLSELLGIMALLFREQYIMEFLSRPHGHLLAPSPQDSRQHCAPQGNAGVGRSAGVSLDMCHRAWLRTHYKKLHGMLSEN